MTFNLPGADTPMPQFINMSTRPLLPLLGAGVCTLALGLYASFGELAPFLNVAPTEVAKVQMLAAGLNQPALSIASQKLYLLDCRIAMTSIAGRLQPTVVRMAVIDHCRAGADGLAAVSPSFSDAWYTGALAAAMEQDWPGFSARLLRSYETGSHEQFTAELRVDLAEEYFDHIDDNLRERHQGDLELLGTIDFGRQFLARRFVASPASRPRIERALSTLDAFARERFAIWVQRLSPPGPENSNVRQ